MSIIFLLQGVSAAVAAKWCMRVGARAAMTVAGFCFGGGLIIGSAGIAIHSLPLLYAGYGVLAGCGIGIAYTPPVQVCARVCVYGAKLDNVASLYLTAVPCRAIWLTTLAAGFDRMVS